MTSTGFRTGTSGGGKRVLVVDPDTDTQVILSTALAAAGYVALVVSDVRDAFALAASGPIHLVITEATSLGVPDLPAALRASTDLARVPMLVYSTRALPGDVERAILAGANEVLVKPVSYRTIVALVDQLTAPQALPARAPPLASTEPPA